MYLLVILFVDIWFDYISKVYKYKYFCDLNISMQDNVLSSLNQRHNYIYV